MNIENAVSFGRRRFFVGAAKIPRGERARYCDEVLAGRPIFGHDGRQPVPVHDPFISKSVRSSPLKTKAPSHPKETSMRQYLRPAATALSIACLATSFALLSPGGALAQGKMAPAPAQAAPPAGAPMQLKQMALTQKQIDGVVAAQ